VPRRVYLHIGPPKTGTTYLQSVLRNNARRLKRAGVLVPGSGPAPHFEAASDLRGRPRKGGRPVASGAWDRLAGEVRDWPGSAVISCEWLAFCDEEQVARARDSFGDAEVHVVVTLRDLGRLVPAVWQEQVKNGKDFTVTQFLDQLAHPDSHPYGRLFWSVHDTRQLVGRWDSQLPVDRIHLVTLPRSGAPPDELWHRFGLLLVSDPEAYDTSKVKANPGLDPADAELLRRVNAELAGRMKKVAHAPLVKHFLNEQLTRRRGSGGKVLLPGPALEQIGARAKDVVQQLRTAGYPVVGSLDDLAVDTSAAATSLPEDAPTDEVARAAVTSMAALLLTMQADGAHRRKAWRARTADGRRRDGRKGGRQRDGGPGGGGSGRPRPPAVARRAVALARRAAGRVRRVARS